MTDEERKAWDRKVWGSLVNDCLNQPEHIYIPHRKSILAADAELKRLREAIEWAIQYLERDVFNVDEVNGLIQWIIDELRRRVKEGK